MNIGILGTGNVGRALAQALTAAGNTVRVASRNPTMHLNFPAPVTSYQAAVEDADIVINATPGSQSLQLLTSYSSDWLAGKVLIDAANAADESGFLLYPEQSLAELLQESLTDVKVVKALNTFNTSVMTEPSVLASPTTTFIAGDDAAAKQATRQVLRDLGWPETSIVDLGGLTAARALEHYFLLFLAIHSSVGTLRFNVALHTAAD